MSLTNGVLRFEVEVRPPERPCSTAEVNRRARLIQHRPRGPTQHRFAKVDELANRLRVTGRARGCAPNIPRGGSEAAGCTRRPARPRPAGGQSQGKNGSRTRADSCKCHRCPTPVGIAAWQSCRSTYPRSTADCHGTSRRRLLVPRTRLQASNKGRHCCSKEGARSKRSSCSRCTRLGRYRSQCTRRPACRAGPQGGGSARTSQRCLHCRGSASRTRRGRRFLVRKRHRGRSPRPPGRCRRTPFGNRHSETRWVRCSSARCPECR